MANKLKKKPAKHPEQKPAPSDLKPFQKEKEEALDLKAIAKDERTWKIIGTVCILLSIFLFISFFSYLFTWKQDQAIAQQGMGALLGTEKPAANLLGNFGAVMSHFFIFKAFGIASFLICTFFFVVGINLLFKRKVFSIWRNLKYVTVGLLVLSVTLSFLSGASAFAWGGGVGNMLSAKLISVLGTLGTAAVLLLVAVGYFIWQFNPTFKMPEKKQLIDAFNEEEQVVENQEAGTAATAINDLYAEIPTADAKLTGNSLKGDAPVVINFPGEEPQVLHDLKIVEKEEQPVIETPSIEKEIVNELLHQHEAIDESDEIEEPEVEPEEEHDVTIAEELAIPVKEKQITKKISDDPLELEIKTVPDPVTDEEETQADPVKKVENLEPYEPTLDLRDYKYPSTNLLETHGSEKIIQDPAELENNKNQIINTLRNYSIEIQKISATVGPTVTLYEIVPAPGVRISKIKNLEDDIALSLAALGIRIIAPIPGKGTIGIEVPNVRKTVVSMKTLLSSDKFQHNSFSLPIAIGKKIDNENFIVDLASMPHLLMAGATGQGKSVGLNAILVSLLYKKHPSQMKFVLIDPKKVELSIYRQIEKHFLAKLPGEEDAIITDTKKVVHTLNALCIEMDNRYDLLKEAGARNIKEYNEKFVKRKLNPQKGHQFLPFIVLVIDEFADLIMTAGKEVEMPIARLAQLARAIGIHLIIATQRPSVNIITGTIKANFPARIAFKVSSKIDSRTILDAGGAEQLIGKGDMLISYNGELTRLQCAFVDTPEVEQIVEFIGDQRGYPQAFLLPEYVDEKELEGKDFDIGDRDSLFEDAARLIVQNQMGSTSLLQRRMKLGYNRAGRLMDQLEAAGIVGPNQGSKARDVLIKTEMDLQQHLDALG
jgi:DNA segregation ATPase FtsK/SpoIIIE, S-DNA-T family